MVYIYTHIFFKENTLIKQWDLIIRHGETLGCSHIKLGFKHIEAMKYDGCGYGWILFSPQFMKTNNGTSKMMISHQTWVYPFLRHIQMVTFSQNTWQVFEVP